MPNSGIATLTVTEARGFVAPPAPIDKAAVIFGVSSAGTAGTLNGPFSNTAAMQAAIGVGPGPTAAANLIDEYQIPVYVYKPPSTNPGTYGTPDVSKFTGTAVPAVGVTTPLEGYTAYVIFQTGTTAIGTTGATYKTALDYGNGNGPTLSTLKQLGTGDTINFLLADGVTLSGAQLVLGPPSGGVTALNTLINDEFTKFNAHVILTTGTVHTSADTADVLSAGTYPSATNTATRVARINAICAAYELHRVKGTGASIHINASGDTVDGLAILTPAVDDETALARALDFQTKYSLHIAGTTWHTVADATNTVLDPAPAAGTIAAGDIVQVQCFGPTWADVDIDAAGAMNAPLCQTTYDFAHLYFAGACASTDAGHVTTLLNNLKVAGKLVDAVIHTRAPMAAESEATWAASVEADFAGFNDDRITIVEGHPTIVVDPSTAQIWLRAWAYSAFARAVASERNTWVGSPNDGGFSDPRGVGPNLVQLYDINGVLIGHDEGPSGNVTGMSDATNTGNRFWCLVRGATQQTRAIAYSTVPWVQYTQGGRIFTFMQRRIAQAIERAAIEVSFSSLGGTAFYDTDLATNISTLVPEYQNAIHTTIFQALTGTPFQDDIENSADDDDTTGLVQVQSVVTVAPGNLVGISVILAPKVAGKILTINLTYAAQ